MKNIITLTMPPTLNASYRARPDGKGQYKTQEAKDWQEEVQWLVNNCTPIEGPVALTFWIIYKFDRDIDACDKLLQDALQGAAYIDDKQIVSRYTYKVKDASNPRLVVEWRAEDLKNLPIPA